MPCKGGKSIDSGGYIRIYLDGKQLREHRVLMSQYLGRPLLRNEHVHHINEVKTDNRIENLQLHTDSSHSKNHRQQFRKNVSSKRRCVSCGTSKTCLDSRNWLYWHFQNHDKTKPVCHNCHMREYYKTRKRPEKKSRMIHRAMKAMFNGV